MADVSKMPQGELFLSSDSILLRLKLLLRKLSQPIRACQRY